MNKPASYEIPRCRGCGNDPIIFDDDDYYQNMYVGCMFSEAYCWMNAEELEKSGGQEGCRLNSIELGNFDGKGLAEVVTTWSSRQNDAAQKEDAAEEEKARIEMEKRVGKPATNFMPPTRGNSHV